MCFAHRRNWGLALRLYGLSRSSRVLAAADFLLPTNHLGERRSETAEKPVGLNLSFTNPEMAPFRPRGQKPRDHSLGINLYSHSPECRPMPCRLETRGVNREIAGER